MSFLSLYQKRRPITIDNSSNTNTLTNYQVQIALTASNFNFLDANSDGSDIRFTDTDGTTLLSYWIESWDSVSALATIWVKIPSVAASTTTIIYFYYGNPSIASSENISDTAVSGIGDDFLGSAGSQPNAALWSVVKKGSSSAVVELDGNGNLHLSGQPSVISSGNVLSLATITNNIIIRIKRKYTDQHYADLSIGNGTIQDDIGTQSDWWHTTQADAYMLKMQILSVRYINRTPAASHFVNLVTSTTLYGSINTWETIEFSYDNFGNLIEKLGGTIILSATDTTYLADSKYLLISQGAYSTGEGGDQYVDWVFMRQYTSPEPLTIIGGVEFYSTSSFFRFFR